MPIIVTYLTEIYLINDNDVIKCKRNYEEKLERKGSRKIFYLHKFDFKAKLFLLFENYFPLFLIKKNLEFFTYVRYSHTDNVLY